MRSCVRAGALVSPLAPGGAPMRPMHKPWRTFRSDGARLLQRARTFLTRANDL